MEVKGVIVLIFLALTIYCVQSVVGRPKDSSVTKIQDITHINDESAHLANKEVTEDNCTKTDIRTTLRIACEFIEPTEDPVCQEHCLPKGYSYGLCISNTCSCI